MAETEVTQEAAVTTEQVLERMKSSKSERLHAQIEAGVVNPIELAKFLQVRPQMIYNYIRDHRIPNVQHSETQKFVIPLQDALTWTAKYLSKKAEQAARVQRELNGES